MSTDRVDKNWQKSGLGGYSTGAIVGTLAHYGIEVDESRFQALATEQLPLSIAAQWHQDWKGTGQFARFPLAAADELYRRACPDKLGPGEFAQALAELVNGLGGLVNERASSELEPAFAKAEGMLAKLPVKDGVPEEPFLDDVFGRMDASLIRAFDELAELLAKADHVPFAERFAALEEQVLPVRAGVSRALIQAAKGDKDGALKALVALANDGSRKGPGRLLPVDALLHLGAIEEAYAQASRLLDEAEAAKEHHLALELCGRVAHGIEALGRLEEMEKLDARMEKIAAEHDAAHPHHAHES